MGYAQKSAYLEKKTSGEVMDKHSYFIQDNENVVQRPRAPAPFWWKRVLTISYMHSIKDSWHFSVKNHPKHPKNKSF